MAPHSSTLAWKITWTEDPGRLQSLGSLSWTRLSDFTFTFQFHALEKEMATHSSVLAWRIPGTGGAWRAAVYGVAQSWPRLKRLSSSSSSGQRLGQKEIRPFFPPSLGLRGETLRSKEELQGQDAATCVGSGWYSADLCGACQEMAYGPILWTLEGQLRIRTAGSVQMSRDK